jgi:hypothetical protein
MQQYNTYFEINPTEGTFKERHFDETLSETDAFHWINTWNLQSLQKNTRYWLNLSLGVCSECGAKNDEFRKARATA